MCRSVEGFGVSMLNLKLARWDAEMKAASQDLYPQLAGQMLFVNPPASLMWVYTRLFRPLLPVRVAEKTRLLDTRTAEGRAHLEQLCRTESLPHFLGGSSRMPWPVRPEHWMPPLGRQTYGEGGSFRRFD